LLNFILNFFSKKRQIAQISANIATGLNTSFRRIKRNNGGEIFSVFKEDKFILGYIIGACHVASHIFNLSKPEHKGTVLIQVHEHLFQENRKYISDYSLSLSANNNDRVYKQGIEAGLTDYSTYLTTIMNMKKDTNPSLMPFRSLDEHLNLNYSSLIDDNESDDDSNFVSSMIEIAQLRNSIEQIYAKYNLSRIDDSVKNKLEPEIVAIAQLIAKESVERSGRTLNQLNDDESFTAMIFCFIASDYLTKKAELNFEVLSAVALTTFLETINQTEKTGLIAEVINSYNSMIAPENNLNMIMTIGSQISKFFASNEDEYLDSLGKSFELMVVNLKPQVA
jgi:hypothetical protein